MSAREDFINQFPKIREPLHLGQDDWRYLFDNNQDIFDGIKLKNLSDEQIKVGITFAKKVMVIHYLKGSESLLEEDYIYLIDFIKTLNGLQKFQFRHLVGHHCGFILTSFNKICSLPPAKKSIEYSILMELENDPFVSLSVPCAMWLPLNSQEKTFGIWVAFIFASKLTELNKNSIRLDRDHIESGSAYFTFTKSKGRVASKSEIANALQLKQTQLNEELKKLGIEDDSFVCFDLFDVPWSKQMNDAFEDKENESSKSLKKNVNSKHR